jgi:hypothetical protein
VAGHNQSRLFLERERESAATASGVGHWKPLHFQLGDEAAFPGAPVFSGRRSRFAEQRVDFRAQDGELALGDVSYELIVHVRVTVYKNIAKRHDPPELADAGRCEGVAPGELGQGLAYDLNLRSTAARSIGSSR